MVAGYLDAERAHGRIATDADVAVLAPTLVGAAHLLFADRDTGPPSLGVLTKMVSTVVATALAHDSR